MAIAFCTDLGLSVLVAVDDVGEAVGSAARHGNHPLRGVATYEDVYRLTCVHGPSGIPLMFAHRLA